MKLCGARAKSTGQPCKRPALANGRCHFHGGLSPGAPKGNSRALRHGFRSGDWRQCLSDAVQRASDALEGSRAPDAQGLAELDAQLDRDALRAESRLLALEARRRDLEASGEFDSRAEAAYFRAVHDAERALNRIRTLRAAVLSRLPAATDDGPHDLVIGLSGGLGVMRWGTTDMKIYPNPDEVTNDGTSGSY